MVGKIVLQLGTQRAHKQGFLHEILHVLFYGPASRDILGFPTRVRRNTFALLIALIAVDQIRYLDHIISKDGIRMDPDKLKIIQE